MSKISSFLKTKRTVKKAAEAPAVAATAAVVEGASKPEAEPKEEWVKDVVDVEIVPVAVRKVDGASDFEDEEIDLPSSMVKSNFEWKKAEDERAAKVAAEKAAAAAEEAAAAAAKKKKASLGDVLVLKKNRPKPVEEMPTLDASYTAVQPTAAAPAPTAATEEPKPATVKAPKPPRVKKEQFMLARKEEGDEKKTCLTSKEIWGVIGGWPRSSFLASA